MTVDIIVATYQRRDLLPKTLASVQQQTYRDWRCWITEDGDDPATSEILAPFLVDPRFQHLTGPHAGFPARPRNRALTKGNGSLIAILDDDDLWLANKLEKQVSFLAAHPACVMVGCNGYRWDGGIAPIESLPVYHRKITPGRIPLRQLVEGNCFITSSVLIRRNALEASGLFNENLSPALGEDYELWLRLAAVGEVWFMADPLLLYREHPPCHYTPLNRQQLRSWKAGILQASLDGFGIASPFSWPQNQHQSELLRKKAIALSKSSSYIKSWQTLRCRLAKVCTALFDRNSAAR